MKTNNTNLNSLMAARNPTSATTMGSISNRVHQLVSEPFFPSPLSSADHNYQYGYGYRPPQDPQCFIQDFRSGNHLHSQDFHHQSTPSDLSKSERSSSSGDGRWMQLPNPSSRPPEEGTIGVATSPSQSRKIPPTISGFKQRSDPFLTANSQIRSEFSNNPYGVDYHQQYSGCPQERHHRAQMVKILDPNHHYQLHHQQANSDPEQENRHQDSSFSNKYHQHSTRSEFCNGSHSTAPQETRYQNPSHIASGIGIQHPAIQLREGMISKQVPAIACTQQERKCISPPTQLNPSTFKLPNCGIHVHELMTKLYSLKDQGSYDDYFLRFVRMVFPIERFTTASNEDTVHKMLLTSFMKGLREDTKGYVMRSAPSNLLHAMNQATYYEDVVKNKRVAEGGTVAAELEVGDQLRGFTSQLGDCSASIGELSMKGNKEKLGVEAGKKEKYSLHSNPTATLQTPIIINSTMLQSTAKRSFPNSSSLLPCTARSTPASLPSFTIQQTPTSPRFSYCIFRQNDLIESMKEELTENQFARVKLKHAISFFNGFPPTTFPIFPILQACQQTLDGPRDSILGGVDECSYILQWGLTGSLCTLSENKRPPPKPPPNLSPKRPSNAPPHPPPSSFVFLQFHQINSTILLKFFLSLFRIFQIRQPSKISSAKKLVQPKDASKPSECQMNFGNICAGMNFSRRLVIKKTSTPPTGGHPSIVPSSQLFHGVGGKGRGQPSVAAALMAAYVPILFNQHPYKTSDAREDSITLKHFSKKGEGALTLGAETARQQQHRWGLTPQPANSEPLTSQQIPKSSHSYREEEEDDLRVHTTCISHTISNRVHTGRRFDGIIFACVDSSHLFRLSISRRDRFEGRRFDRLPSKMTRSDTIMEDSPLGDGCNLREKPLHSRLAARWRKKAARVYWEKTLETNPQRNMIQKLIQHMGRKKHGFIQPNEIKCKIPNMLHKKPKRNAMLNKENIQQQPSKN